MFPRISSIEYTKETLFEEPGESESILSVQTAKARLSQSAETWRTLTLSAIEIAAHINPFSPDIPEGTVIPAIDAVNWSLGNTDIRPRLVDKSTGEARLIDSGAQISAAKRLPGDKVDNSIRLVAVNGSRIETFGTRKITMKIGRKTYSIDAIICEVKQDILGMDFVNKYRLGLEWDDFDQTELYIVDKKSKIRNN